MDAPTCTICGKQEWRHVCAGTPARRKLGERTPREAKFDRTKYQRELMRKRRAAAKAKEKTT
jgi:hypothetical protein